MVVYYPNFGGYLPYTQWRCAWDSEECFTRLPNYTYTGVKAGETHYLDRYCSVVLADPGTQDYSVTLMDGEKNVRGSLTTKNGFLTVDSGPDCVDTVNVTCETKVTLPPADQGCILVFPNPTEEETQLVCSNNGTEKSLDVDEVQVLTNSTTEIRFVKFGAASSKAVRCPDVDQYSKDTMCGTGDKAIKLKQGTDFVWDMGGRSYFTVEWDLLCDREWLKAQISSIYFGGAFLGTLAGGNLYDLVGRRWGALIGYALVTLSTFAVSASPHVIFLFVCRFLQGVGVFVGYPGMFVLMLEYTASKYRSLANSAPLIFWAVGYLLTSLIGYTVYSWRWNSAITGFVNLVTAIPLFLVPESARFLLIGKDNVQAAIGNLKWLAKINKASFDGNDLELTDREQMPEEQPTFLQSLNDFAKYPELAIQTLCQMWLWMVSGFVYYGFSFSWSNLSSNMYIGYLLAAVGEVIAYILMVPMLEKMGRKWANMAFFFIGSASFLVAMINLDLGSGFELKQLSCLIGSMAIAAVFGSIYLYTMELAPTSHRGKIMGNCSFAARVGAFLGPQAPLLFAWSNIGALVIFACLSLSAGLMILRLPNTGHIPTPSTAADVQERARGKVAAKSTVTENQAV